MVIPGFDDISATLRTGVYILAFRGRVVFVGSAKCTLTRLAEHRSLFLDRAPDWLPVRGINYDEVHFSPTHPDAITSTIATLVARYDPIHNRARSHDRAA